MDQKDSDLALTFAATPPDGLGEGRSTFSGPSGPFTATLGSSTCLPLAPSASGVAPGVPDVGGGEMGLEEPVRRAPGGTYALALRTTVLYL